MEYIPEDIIEKLKINVVDGKYKLKRTLHNVGAKFEKECIKQNVYFRYPLKDHPRHDGRTTIFSSYDYDEKELLKLKSFCDKDGFKLSVYTKSIYHPSTTDFVIQY